MEKIKIKQTPIIMMRVMDTLSAQPVLRDETTRISYTLYYVTATTKTPVEGHEDVEIDLDCLRNYLDTECHLWTRDDIGFNFMWTPDTTEYPLFVVRGNYRLSVTFEFDGRNPHTEHVLFNVF